MNNMEPNTSSVVPPAPPPPIMRNEVFLEQGKNLLKCAASLIGKGDDKIAKESALNVCETFLTRHRCQTKESDDILWFYHNNDVEAYLQDGPTCGLICLKLAADILKISRSKSTNEIEDLLKVAQENGFTYHGEMFSAQDMGLLAEQYYKLKYKVVNDSLEDYLGLLHHLYQGYPVLVPYDADRNHEPCLKKGHKAHWAVVTGFLVGLKNEDITMEDSVDGNITSIHPFHFDQKQTSQIFNTEQLYFITRQGKSRHYAIWHWIRLNNSNRNLLEFDEGQVREQTNYMFTEGMKNGLCSKIILLFPQD